MARRRPYKRTDRLSSQIKQVLAVALQRETREESLHQVILTDVEVTNELSVARVYYYVMAGDKALIAQALGRAVGFLRRRVGEEIRARQTPELRFIYDDAVDRGRRIEEILAGLPETQHVAADDAETSPENDGAKSDSETEGVDADSSGD